MVFKLFACLVVLGLANEGHSACTDPAMVGPCRGQFYRYFFNPDSASCELFIYGGCGGNDNNYLSLEDCQNACPLEAKSDVAINPDCNLPSESGFCEAYIPRYFYNPASGACEQFIYGGCRGNANNFLDITDCQQACIPQAKRDAKRDVSLSPDCSLPSEVGPCRGLFPRFFFNTNTGSCMEFIYGGCGGNANNYESLEECQQACTANTKREATPPPACSLPSETGPCKAYFPRFFFNINTGSCEEFIYGGCNGNTNNYMTIEDCQQACLLA